MNDFGMTLVGAALQGLLVALAAVGLYAVAARRTGAGAVVATAYLGLSALLALLAFCPLPAWWTWERPTAIAELRASSDAPPNDRAIRAEPAPAGQGTAGSAVGRDASGTGWSLAALRDRLPSVRFTMPPTPEQREVRWPGWIGIVFLAGSGLYVLRLLIGLWAVHALRRHSQTIDDPALGALRESLRTELGCRRRVELRETRDVSTPATIGWRRPLVLLPRTWRQWSEAERRAVLAHELAHVCRGDYAVGLLTRISIALQFYQPLVHFLAGRLHLQQELAADALAARVSGGRGPYLRALAQLALRQEGRLPGWPAWALLSKPGTLMRRIQMLQGRDFSGERTRRRAARTLLVALLTVVVVGVSALRSPAQKPGEDVSKEPGSKKTRGLSLDIGLSGSIQLNQPNTAVVHTVPLLTGAVALNVGYAVGEEPPAFDLTYLASDYPGVIAFRPVAVFSRPELKTIMPFVNREFKKAFQETFQTRTDFDLPLEEIEQVICPCIFRTEKNSTSDHPSELMCTLGVIRMVHDFNWKQQIQALEPELAEVSYGGKVYYRYPPGKKILSLGLGLKDCCIYLPDSRTLVLANENALHRLIDGKPARPTWADDWHHVAHGLFAVAFDSRDKSWYQDRDRTAVEKETDALVYKVAELANRVLFGMDGRQGMAFQFIAQCDTPEASAQAAQAMRDLIHWGVQEVWQNYGDKTKDVQLRLLYDGLQQAQVVQRGAAVVVQSRTKMGFAELLKEIVREIPPDALKE